MAVPSNGSCSFNTQPGSFPAADRSSFPRTAGAQGYRTANSSPRKAVKPLAAHYFGMGGDFKLCLHLLPCEGLVLQHCRCFPSRNSPRRGEHQKRAGKHKRRSMCLRTIPRRLLPLSGSIRHRFKLFVSPFAVAFPEGALLSHQETSGPGFWACSAAQRRKGQPWYEQSLLPALPDSGQPPPSSASL